MGDLKPAHFPSLSLTEVPISHISPLSSTEGFVDENSISTGSKIRSSCRLWSRKFDAGNLRERLHWQTCGHQWQDGRPCLDIRGTMNTILLTTHSHTYMCSVQCVLHTLDVAVYSVSNFGPLLGVHRIFNLPNRRPHPKSKIKNNVRSSLLRADMHKSAHAQQQRKMDGGTLKNDKDVVGLANFVFGQLRLKV